MSTRHQAREVAFQILYRHDQVRTAAKERTPTPLSGPIPNYIPPATPAEGAAPPVKLPMISAADLALELQDHFNHFHVEPELREFAALLAAGTIRHSGELDEILEKHAANWRISRMSLIDRNLLRMAIYELKHIAETPPSVVLNEAIELAKQFGTSESPAFINGVLDAVKTEIVGTNSSSSHRPE